MLLAPRPKVRKCCCPRHHIRVDDARIAEVTINATEKHTATKRCAGSGRVKHSLVWCGVDYNMQALANALIAQLSQGAATHSHASP